MTSLTPGADDAAECRRLREMLRALIDSGATAKTIVMVTMDPSQKSGDLPMIIISTPDEMPDADLAELVSRGFARFMLALVPEANS